MHSAAISVLAEAGIRGIEAEIALRRVQSLLVAPSEEGRERLAALGLELAALDPNLHRLADVVGRLARSGLDEADAFTIFGRRGAPAILALIAGLERLEELQRPE